MYSCSDCIHFKRCKTLCELWTLSPNAAECIDFSQDIREEADEITIKILRSRLNHLLQSKFISSFDEVNSNGEYKRNIREADETAAISKEVKRIIRILWRLNNE